MADPTLAYGSLYGPVVESDKTVADMQSLAYGSLYGPVVGVGAPPAGTAIPVFMHHYEQMRRR